MYRFIFSILIINVIFTLSAKEIVKNGIWDEESGTWVVFNQKRDRVELFYNNGKKAFEGAIEIISSGLQNGGVSFRKKGKWIGYYPTGEIYIIENYNDRSELDGKQTLYYKNKKIQRELTYKNGKQNGRWVYYDDKGSLCAESEFFDGKLIKWKIIKVIDEKLEKPPTVTDGAEWDKKIEKWRFFDSDKRIMYGWYINGEKWCEMHIDKERIANGDFISWDTDGKISEEGHYVNDKQNGLWLSYEGGVLVTKEQYIDGNIISVEVIGAPSRPKNVPLNAYWEDEFKHWDYVDKKTLEQIIYYEDGTKKEEGKVVFDSQRGYLANGARTVWRQDGKLYLLLNYISGELNGVCLSYDEKERPSVRLLYKNGKVIKSEVIKK